MMTAVVIHGAADLEDAVEIAEERMDEAFSALADGANEGNHLWFRLCEAAYLRFIGDTEWYHESIAHVNWAIRAK